MNYFRFLLLITYYLIIQKDEAETHLFQFFNSILFHFLFRYKIKQQQHYIKLIQTIQSKLNIAILHKKKNIINGMMIRIEYQQ